MTDRYTKPKRAVSFRKTWAEKVGLGFELPASAVVKKDNLNADVAPNAPKIDTPELAVVP